MNLKEALNYIETNYSQSEIQIRAFDFESRSIKQIKQPKYLFRGESKNYPKTQTTFYRRLQSDFFNSNQWSQIQYATNHLYLFLRFEFWNIPTNSNSPQDPIVEHYIIGLLQHYRFDSSFFDLTSDLKVAANFASSGEIGETGRLFVIPTKKIIENCFDLTSSPGKRPQIQKAFALWDSNRGLDIKDKQFLSDYSAEWIDFTIESGDNIYKKTDFYYSTESDKTVDSIIDWYENSEIKMIVQDLKVIKYFDDIIKDLRNYGG